MLVPNQYVEVNWHSRNKKHLESKGYKYTHTGLPVQVAVEDIMHGSKCRVRVVCDYCGKEYTKVYKDYFNQRQNGKDCCRDCSKYECFETNMERYGTISSSSSPDVIKKTKQTLLERYGVDNTMAIPSVKQKVRNTNIERYGFPTPAQSERVKAKMAATNQARYGGNSSQCDPVVRAKTLQSFVNNGTNKVSKPEKEMVELLKELYGEQNCVPQYVYDRMIFDCLLTIDSIQIDVEFDGIYWHKDVHKDIKRDYFTISKGYKVLRFRGDYSPPTLEQIKQGIDYLTTTEHHHLIINV